MSSRRTKQVVYGLIYAIFWGAIIAGVYFLFFKPAPSCFDHIQNEGETGVDCGGPCAKLCIPSDIQPISILGTVNVFSPVPGHVTLLAQVENPNSDFAADTFNYTFTLYDAAGNILQSIPGTSFIYADQTEYLVVPNEAVSAAVDRATLTIGTINWVPAAELGLVPQFAFQNLAAVPAASGTIAINGTMIDKDASAFNNISVVAILKSSNGAVAGVSETQVDSIAPNQTQNFSVMYPSAVNIAPSQTQMYAYSLR